MNLYFFNKNWQHCKLAAVQIFKISFIYSPIDAFEGGMNVFGIHRKKISLDGESPQDHSILKIILNMVLRHEILPKILSLFILSFKLFSTLNMSFYLSQVFLQRCIFSALLVRFFFRHLCMKRKSVSYS